MSARTLYRHNHNLPQGTLSCVMLERSADELIDHLRQTLAARAGEADEVLLHQRAEPARSPSLGVLRPRLPAPLARAVLKLGIRQLYEHQVAAVEVLRADKNIV